MDNKLQVDKPAPLPRPDETCPQCEGTGKGYATFYSPEGSRRVYFPCSLCQGTGRVRARRILRREEPEVEVQWDAIREKVVKEHYEKRLRQEFELLSEEADWVDG